MPYQLEAAVLKEIHRTFSSADQRSYVERKLAETGLPMGAVAPPPRVHVAILWIAKGDLAAFDRALANACADWRDTLVAAGLANQNWRTVLAGRGVDCSDWPVPVGGSAAS